ncbi:MAG: hypothetical protein EP338_04595 [Bacteroidetes bacterium]|nr:MAG: hypothetical protein EP338_04595 [Bacteroidota bacterium]
MIPFRKLPYTVLLLLLPAILSCDGKKKQVSEGMLTFSIDYPDNRDNFFLYRVLPKEMKASFRDNVMEIKIKKAGLENTIIIDGKRERIAAHYNYGEVVSSVLTKSDKKKLVDAQPDYQVKLTNEEDTLAGFKILKAEVTDPNFPDHPFDVWYTKDIRFENPNWFNGFDKIPGVLMRYTIRQYGMKMVFEAKEFQHVTISDSIVSMKRPGKLISHEQFDAKIQELFDTFK